MLDYASPGPPGEVGGLELTYYSKHLLQLHWSRPVDALPDVPITYVIHITNTSSAAISQVKVSQMCNNISITDAPILMVV